MIAEWFAKTNIIYSMNLADEHHGMMLFIDLKTVSVYNIVH